MARGYEETSVCNTPAMLWEAMLENTHRSRGGMAYTVDYRLFWWLRKGSRVAREPLKRLNIRHWISCGQSISAQDFRISVIQNRNCKISTVRLYLPLVVATLSLPLGRVNATYVLCSVPEGHLAACCPACTHCWQQGRGSCIQLMLGLMKRKEKWSAAHFPTAM